MNATAVDVLRYARDVVLSSPSKWHQGSYADTDTLCALGAVDQALDDLGCVGDVRFWGAMQPLYHVASPLTVVEINDDPDTTFSDVIDLFDKAVKYAEEAS